MCCEVMRVLPCVQYMEEDLEPNPECDVCFEEFDVNELLVRDPQIS